MISKLIFNGVENYRFTYAGNEVELPLEIKKEIDNYWKHLISLGKKYTNGDLFTVEDIKIDEDKYLNFTINKTKFAHYLYTVKNNFEGKYICRSIATSALFITKDNYYVFGKMSSNTSLGGKIKFIGGAISTDDFVEDKFIPENCIEREVREEIGIDIRDKLNVRSMNLKYFITRKNLSFINICFEINLHLTSNEIMNMFNSYNEYLANNKLEQELEKIVLVEKSNCNIKEFLIKNKDILIDYMEELLLVEVGVLKARDFYDDFSSTYEKSSTGNN